METNHVPDAPKRWRNYWQDHPVLTSDEELAVLVKRYLNPDTIFCAGQYFFFVIEGGQDFRVRHLQGNFEQITGFAKELFVGKSMTEMHRLMIPPDDRPVLLDFSSLCMRFFSNAPPDKRRHIKFSFYFNAMHKSGRLVPVIQQDIVHTNAEGFPIYNFSFVTDISHLKVKNDLMFSIMTVDDQGNQQFKYVSARQPLVQIQIQEKGLLTVRERQIISGLAEGLSSKQIAADLGITFHTVNTHRQKMLAKTGCTSSAQLVRYALENTLI
jgi:DNA-binding CsgD family transcriptional regulator